MAIAQPLPQTRSRLGRAWDALLGREVAVPEALPPVTFAEVIWAHHQRQEKEVYKDTLNGPWHDEYQRRLALFSAQHGEIIQSYWCRYEASGVALTEKSRPGRLANLYRRDSLLRLHAATDWRTANAPEIAATLHRWQTVAIKTSEILRDTSERVALHRIFAATTRLLAFVDRKRGQSIAEEELEAVIQGHDRDIADVTEYYDRAGENAARIIYFRGMIWGAALLALVGAGTFLIAWRAGWIEPQSEAVYTIFVAMTMGALGAVLSVMTRMGRRDSRSVEFEVGRKTVRHLGGIRPWIGALSALVIYLAIKSELVEFVQGSEKGIYFYATVAFLSGFSERRATVLLGRIGGGDGDDDGRSRRGGGANGGDGVSRPTVTGPGPVASGDVGLPAPIVLEQSSAEPVPREAD